MTRRSRDRNPYALFYFLVGMVSFIFVTRPPHINLHVLSAVWIAYGCLDACKIQRSNST